MAKKSNYLGIPFSEIDNMSLLTSKEYLTLLILRRRVWRSPKNPELYKAYNDGYLLCCAGTEKIASYLGLSVNSIYRHIKKLTKLGLVKRYFLNGINYYWVGTSTKTDDGLSDEYFMIEEKKEWRSESEA